MTTSTLDKQLAEINRLREAELKLWIYATCRQHYAFGTPEYRNAKKCSWQAAKVHGQVTSILRWLNR